MRTLHRIVICCSLLLAAAALQAADPNAYHWQGQSPFFEGWYFKVSDSAADKSFLIIYAILNPDSQSPHSCGFMMVGNNSGDTAERIYTVYPVDAVSADHTRFDIAVANNRAWGDQQQLHAQGAIVDAHNTCRWVIDYTITDQWPRTMGWMSDLPMLQTYWHVGAMHARASGWVEWNGRRWSFDNATGYQEKNWGVEFPDTWFWLQANDFNDPRACCLSVGGASMPLGHASLDACGIGFRYAGTLYTFSFPVEPARIHHDIIPGHWSVEGTRGRHRIVIDAWCSPDQLINLMNPRTEGIKPWTWETIRATLRVRLYTRFLWWWVKRVDTWSPMAGAEFGGEAWVGWDE